MELKKVGFLSGCVVIIWIAVAWLSPIQASNVDLLGWLTGPFLFATLYMSAYFAAMAHKGGFAVTWSTGHSATAHGGVAFEVPALGNYPEVVAVPLGGGNVMGVILSGGGKSGWLIVPKDHILETNRQIYCSTNVREVRPSDLPGHILARLKQHRLFDPRGPIAYGLLPNKEYQIERLKAVDLDKLQAELDRLQAANNGLDDMYRASLDTSHVQSKQIKRAAIKSQEEEQPLGLREKLMGPGED